MIVKLYCLVFTIFSLLILEYRFPFFKFANSIWQRISSNFELGLLNSIASSIFTVMVANYSMLYYRHLGILDAIDSPIITGIISMMAIDLYMYWWHRSMHLIPVAWRFHRIHHTDRSMNVSTAYRFHPIEIHSSSIPKLILVWWLGIAIEMVQIYELVFTVIVALHHSNVAIPLSIDRLLSTIIVTPNYHRIHHSQLVTETNSNYGSVLTCWDGIFQTRNNSIDPTNTNLGVSDENRDLNLWQLLKLPLSDR